jgi:hypothetical protein
MAEPMTTVKNDKILDNRQAILDYTGLSPYKYLKFIKLGMPVIYIDGHCYAHTDNLDEFFRAITRGNSKNLPEDILLAEEENPASKKPVKKKCD